jgi:hypothetical protein
MQKTIGIVALLGLLMLFGCAEQKPEAAAKKIVDQQVAIHHEGFELDTSKVSYRVVTQDDDSATVEVSGNIAVRATIPLTKKDGEWVLAMPAAEVEKESAAKEKTAAH